MKLMSANEIDQSRHYHWLPPDFADREYGVASPDDASFMRHAPRNGTVREAIQRRPLSH
jgi:hypothetical protein